MQLWEFLKFIFSPQMLPYSLPLFVMLSYWIFFVAGVVRLEILDGAADGAVEALAESAADGAAEAVAESAVLDAIVEENTVGLLASADLAADVAGSVSPEPAYKGKNRVFGRLVRYLHFGQVPATIILSIVITMNWLLGFLGLLWISFGSFEANHPFLEGILRFIVTFIVTVFLSEKLTHPIAKLFSRQATRSEQHLVGTTCRIKSSVADQSFGEAELQIEDSFILISVRTSEDIKKNEGDLAIITGYDKEKNVYFVK